MDLNQSPNEKDDAKPFVSLGALPVTIREDLSVLVDITGVQLSEGKFEVTLSGTTVLKPTDRRPLAALLETSAGDARFEIGNARVVEGTIQMQLFGAPFLPVRYLTFDDGDQI